MLVVGEASLGQNEAYTREVVEGFCGAGRGRCERGVSEPMEEK